MNPIVTPWTEDDPRWDQCLTSPAGKQADSATLLAWVKQRPQAQAMWALRLLKTALDRLPRAAQQLAEQGNRHLKQGERTQADACFSQAIPLAPELPELCYQLGQAHWRLGKVQQAQHLFSQALVIQPDHDAAFHARSLCALKLQQWPRGWGGYVQSLFRGPRQQQLPPADYCWQGQTQPQNNTLHLRQAATLADMLLFASCLPDVLHQGIKVQLECPTSLQTLFQRSFPSITLVDTETADGWQELADEITVSALDILPSIYRTHAQNFPRWPGYLQAAPCTNKQLEQAPPKQGVRFGCLLYRHACPLPPDALCDHGGVVLHPPHHPLDWPASWRMLPLPHGEDPSCYEAHLDDIASQLAILDRLLTDDPLLAQLACALNVPVWLLSPPLNDWRWPAQQAFSPWMPGLFSYTGDAQSLGHQLDDEWALWMQQRGWQQQAARAEQSGDKTTALRLIKRWQHSAPWDPEPCYTWAALAMDQGDDQEAEHALLHLLQQRPCCATSCYNLAMIYRQRHHNRAALRWLQQALRMHPHLVRAHNSLANVCKDLGLISDALRHYQRVLELDPAYSGADSNRLYTLLHDETSDDTALAQSHRDWGQQYFRGIPPLCQRQPQPLTRPLRIGYVSPDFRGHPVAIFMGPLLQHHRHSVEVFAYANQAMQDDITTRLQRKVDHWRDIWGMGDEAVARMILQDDIDILVDLAGHTAGHRLGVFAHRPAPLQASYLGYPHGTGLPEMDLRIADGWTNPPGSEWQYRETLLRLPDAFFCYRRPDVDVPLAPPPVLHQGHITFGVFHTSLGRISTGCLRRWAAILKALPEARLRLVCRPFREPRTRTLYQQTLEQVGLPLERIKLLPDTDFVSYFQAHNAVDIVLDTHPWSGHTTSCHALWMGVPVLTLAGSRHAARMGASILSNLGLHDWIANDDDAYIQLACNKAQNPEALAELRAGLRTRMLHSPLMDGERFALNMEALLHASWKDACQQITPPATHD